MVKSLQDEISPEVKANEIMLQSQADPRAFVIVEGKTDFRLFNEILADDEWEVEYLDGKHNVVKCINDMVDAGLVRGIAVLDRDPFDQPLFVKRAIFSENADLDSDMFNVEGLIDRLIKRNSNIRDEPVLRQFGYVSWFQLVVSLVLPWTAVRDYASRNSISFSFSDFPIHEIGNRETCELSIAELQSVLMKRSGGVITSSDVEEALAVMDAAAMVPCVNGHHISRVIAWVLSSFLQSDKLSSTSVEDLARMGIENSDLRNLKVLCDLLFRATLSD